MQITRIVPNIATEQLAAAKAFYGELLGLTLAMDHGWLLTFVGAGQTSPQVSFAVEGGSGTPVPELSLEVDDLDEVLRRLERAGYAPEYGPVTEPWGVRRFFVRDPGGRLLNFLEHA
ncbi:VOC family protein [Pseudoxanthomonas composti]|uniref:Glyoxalase n=1 Tax=Pseudoxanthomonas composti TaxID=2137479 RepID=A0A4Q1JXW9_9GAMM|nr:VOC family protein [Pseudoxanthomonas composti]RXR07368.1 glyoxalase [Pseudoxanthomonas composti]